MRRSRYYGEGTERGDTEQNDGRTGEPSIPETQNRKYGGKKSQKKERKISGLELRVLD